jgi:hypothetical protein
MVSDSRSVPYKRRILVETRKALPMADSNRMTPRRSIEAECERRGKTCVDLGCIDWLDGGEIDDGLVLALGGAPAE